jgi:hypothetical protein
MGCRVELQKGQLLQDEGIRRNKEIVVIITEQERLSEPQLFFF